MLPLMRTTWIINRRLLFQFSPFLAFYLWMIVNAQSKGDPIQMAGVLVVFSALLTVIVTLQGLLLPVEEFILSLPISRSQVVRAKYLSSLLGLAVGLALPLLTAWTAHRVAPDRVGALSPEVLGLGGLTGLALAFGIFLFLPFVYRFGPARGLTFFSLSLVLCIAGGIAWKGRWGFFEPLLKFSGRVLENGVFALTVGAGVALFGIGSMFFSIWTYRRKGGFGVGPSSRALAGSE